MRASEHNGRAGAGSSGDFVKFLENWWTQQGFKDARRGRGFCAAYETADPEAQWWYEWGRQLAVANPELPAIGAGRRFNLSAFAFISAVESGALRIGVER